MHEVDLIAVTCVLASDHVWRQPGDRWTCPVDEAEALVSSGAARLAPSADGDSGPVDLTLVTGIGPVTAVALRDAGVPDLVVLTALTDADIEGLALDPATTRQLRDDWRGQARALLDGAESSG